MDNTEEMKNISKEKTKKKKEKPVRVKKVKSAKPAKAPKPKKEKAQKATGKKSVKAKESKKKVPKQIGRRTGKGNLQNALAAVAEIININRHALSPTKACHHQQNSANGVKMSQGIKG